MAKQRTASQQAKHDAKVKKNLAHQAKLKENSKAKAQREFRKVKRVVARAEKAQAEAELRKAGKPVPPPYGPPEPIITLFLPSEMVGRRFDGKVRIRMYPDAKFRHWEGASIAKEQPTSLPYVGVTCALTGWLRQGFPDHWQLADLDKRFDMDVVNKAYERQMKRAA